MAKGQLDKVFRQIRILIGGRGAGAETDGQLLERFHLGNDQAAFRTLVERHGPMVLRACQRVLTDPNDAEDVFQATFLVLVRKAGSLDGSRSLANWLYTVAYRLALNLKDQAARRQAHERLVPDMPSATTMNDPSWQEVRLVLDEELNRLPVKYREPLVLCYLQGKTNEQAAQELGCPTGSMSWRLGQARDQLRKRLGQRGIELASGTIFTALAQDALSATIPTTLLENTVQAAAVLVTGQSLAAGAVSAQAIRLSEGAIQAMFITKLKIAAVVLLTLGFLGTGAGVLTHRAFAEKSAATRPDDGVPAAGWAGTESAGLPAAEEAADKKPANADEAKKQAGISGVVVGLAPDGKSLTLEIPAKKGGEPGKIDIKLTEKTTITYFNVPPGGATPTMGYFATVQLVQGTTDMAAQLSFAVPKERTQGPDVSGPIMAVAADGKSFAVELPAKKKGDAPQRLEIKLTDTTAATYFHVAANGARPTVGYEVQVWFVEGSADVAARVYMGLFKKDESQPMPDRAGPVVAVTADGKRITLEARPTKKGEAGGQFEIGITATTEITYTGIGTTGAMPKVGYKALVWLVDGKDTAARISFHASVQEQAASIIGRLVSATADGQRLTVDVPPSKKEGVAKQIEIQLTAKTKVTYSGVGPGGAKLTEGYQVHVWLAEGTKDIAAVVQLEAVGAKKGDEPSKPKGNAAADGKDKPVADAKTEPAKDAKKPAPDAKTEPAKDGNKPAPDAKNEPAKETKKPAPDGKTEPAKDGKKTDDQGKPGAKGETKDDKPVGAGIVVAPLSERDPLAVAAAIDQELSKRLAEAQVPVSGLADDAEFLRRVTLDITGRIPTVEKAQSFLDSRDPDKRRKLIDELLTTSECGQHLANVWRQLIVPPVPGVGKNPADTFTPWLVEQFDRNRGWDRIVFDLLTAEGEVARNPQSAFIMANSENGQPQANMLAGATARLFLGVQLQCAECHNHPFDHWKQTDFWSVAAFYGRLTNGGTKGQPLTLNELPAGDNSAKGRKPQSGLVVTAAGGAIVIPASAGKGVGQVVKARFLGGDAPVLDDQAPWRPRLAAWATAPENPYFATALVNRVWSQFFGRGFVNPVDNFRDDNPASHPVLLQRLADEFKASGHDIKHLIRCLCNSQAYQRSSQPPPNHVGNAQLFSHMAVKALSPEAFYDSLTIVLTVNQTSVLKGSRTKAGGKEISALPRQQFIDAFRPLGESADGGGFDHGIPQFLRRMNSELFNAGSPMIDRMVKTGESREKIIESLYLATLTRRPSNEETRLMTEYLSRRGDSRQGYAGVLWILLNSGEFILNH